MLFQPFQILSVQRIEEEYLSSMPGEYCGILCCGNGSGQINADSKTLRFHEGICLFACEAGAMSLEFEQQASRLYWIELKINHVDLLQKFRCRLIRLHCSPRNMDKLCQDGGAFSTLYQLLELLLLEHMEQAGQASPSLEALVGYDGQPAELMNIYAAISAFLDANLQNDFTASQLAAAVGCSHRQLNNLLQKHNSCTTLEFVNEYRIQKARLYLIGSEHTITQIASLTGFKSVHYFSRVFKKLTGMSPQAFRSSCMGTETE